MQDHAGRHQPSCSKAAQGIGWLMTPTQCSGRLWPGLASLTSETCVYDPCPVYIWRREKRK